MGIWSGTHITLLNLVLHGDLLGTPITLTSIVFYGDFQNGTAGSSADSCLSQRGLSKDGCAYVAKELQRYTETNNTLTAGSVNPDILVIVTAAIVHFFPSVDRQALLDMCAGVASKDYPHTSIKKGYPLPSHPIFQTLLPLITFLYGQTQRLYSYSRGRKLEYVSF
jgi:hypothetical protein